MTTSPNPYRPPAAKVSRDDPSDVLARPRGLSITAIVTAATAVIVAGIAPQQLKSFRELFAGFGAELPWLSQLALAGAWIWILLAAAAVAVAIWIAGARFATRTKIRRMRIALAACIVLFAVVFAITLVALYLPIFTLGAVV